MKSQELLNLSIRDLMKLDEKTLRNYVRRLSSTANKRLNRLKEAGFDYAPAYTEKRFSTKDKNLNQLRNEYTLLRNFLNKKTSTVSQFRKYNNETLKRLEAYSGEVDIKEFWRTYRKLVELDPKGVQDYDSNNAQKDLYKLMRKHDVNDSLDLMLKKISTEYEKKEEELSNDDFFELSEDDDDDIF